MNSDALDNLTPTDLHERCRQHRQDNTHERFCFELFRRAIVEKSQPCWTVIYKQYEKLVGSWALQFAGAGELPDNIVLDEIVVDAFAAFWRAFTADKLDNAQGLSSVLKFLKSCAATSMLQVRRKATKAPDQVEWNEIEVDLHQASQQSTSGIAEVVLQELTAAQLWELVDQCCSNEKERIIARLSFVDDLKPVSILERHPDLFTDVAEIYTLRRNLKNRLLRNDALRRFWGE